MQRGGLDAAQQKGSSVQHNGIDGREADEFLEKVVLSHFALLNVKHDVSLLHVGELMHWRGFMCQCLRIQAGSTVPLRPTWPDIAGC